MDQIPQCIQSQSPESVLEGQVWYAVITTPHGGLKLTKAFVELLASLAYPMLDKGFYH